MRSIVPIIVVLCALAGCRLRPEDPIFIYGRLQTAEGQPLQDRVLVERSGPGFYESPRELRAWEPFDEVEAASDGSFTVEMSYGDTRRALRDGQEQTLLFRLRPASHQSTSIELALMDGDVELPPLRVFLPDAEVTLDGEGLLVRRGPLPPPLEVPEAATAVQSPPNPDGSSSPNPSTPAAVVELATLGAPFWRASMEAEELLLSREVLEDFAEPVAQVIAASRGWFNFEPLVRQYSSLSFKVAWQSEPLAVASGARAPLSRGAACTGMETPCRLTDGQLDVVDLADETYAIEIELGAARSIRRAVVRGLRTSWLPEELLLEARGTDGAWVKLGDFMRSKPDFDPSAEVDLYAELELPAEASVTRVRLRAIDQEAQPVALEALRELSLFD